MQPYQVRRAAIILLGVILIVFVVVQGVRFIGNITGGGGEEVSSQPSELTLPDYDGRDSRVRLTHSGEIEGREEYHQIRMTISADNRVLEIINGYGNNVAKRQRLNNTSAAYGTFLRALHLNNFANFQENELGDDERGVCFRGERIVGEVFDDGDEVMRLWAASCDNDLGTMDANWRDVLRLFEDQFPEHREFTRGIRL